MRRPATLGPSHHAGGAAHHRLVAGQPAGARSSSAARAFGAPARRSSARDAGHHLGASSRIRAGGTHVPRWPVVLARCPWPPTARMLCYQYGGNSRAIAQGTFVTTVLAIASEYPHPGRLRRRGDRGNRTTDWGEAASSKETTATMPKRIASKLAYPGTPSPTFGNPLEHRARETACEESAIDPPMRRLPAPSLRATTSRERHLRRLRLFRRPPRSLRQRKPFRQAQVGCGRKRPPRETPRSRIGPGEPGGHHARSVEKSTRMGSHRPRTGNRREVHCLCPGSEPRQNLLLRRNRSSLRSLVPQY